MDTRMSELFDIGAWIECEDGLGQVLFVRQLYRDSFEESRQNEKVGELRQVNVICKLLCGFNGKIKKSKRIKSYLFKHCDLISDKHLEVVKRIKLDEPEEYHKYILYDDDFEVSNVVRLRYRVDSNELPHIDGQIEKIRNKLLPAFTFKDFSKEFKKMGFSFNLDDFISYKHEYKREEIVELVFNNRAYKTKGKDKVFDWVKIAPYD